MKGFWDVLGTIFIILILGKIAIGAIEEGFAVQVLLIIFVLGLFIYISIQRENKKVEQERKEREAKKNRQYEEKILELKKRMYSFAYKNKRISILIYDIEEGGSYLKEYVEGHKIKIDEIINNIIKNPNNTFDNYSGLIEKEILKLPVINHNKRHIGFD